MENKQDIQEIKNDLIDINNSIKDLLINLFIKEKSSSKRQTIIQELERMAQVNHFNLYEEIFDRIHGVVHIPELDAQAKDVLTYRPALYMNIQSKARQLAIDYLKARY